MTGRLPWRRRPRNAAPLPSERRSFLRRRPAPTLPGGAPSSEGCPGMCRRAASILQYLFLSISIACFLALFGYVGFLFGTWYGTAEYAPRIPTEESFDGPPPIRRSLAPQFPRKHDINENSLPHRTLFYAYANATLEQKIFSLGTPQSAPMQTVTLQTVTLQPEYISNLRVEASAGASHNLLDDSGTENAPSIDAKWYSPNALDDSDFKYNAAVCEPMEPWQLASRPNCNAFHEIDLPHVRLVGTGGARVAFELLDADGSTKVVYKALKYKRGVNPRRVEEQRRDALIMDQASSSNFTPDIHGFCGVGVVMDFMPEGNLHDYVKGARLPGGSSLSPVDKLRVALHLVRGVADMHTKTNYYHFDVAVQQYLFQDGVFKLNDFNVAGPFYRNKTSGEHCTRERYETEKYLYKGRSLEEFQNILNYANYTAPDPAKVDIWMLGGVIFSVLTGEYLYEKPRLNMRPAARKMVLGERPPFPQHIRESTDPSHLAMKQALDMCWTYKWQERPAAEAIASYLHGRLKEITGEKDPDIRVTLPERDPKQKGTESDFVNANCDHNKNGRIIIEC